MINSISSDVRRILEKLYNLKSSDSIVLISKQAEIASIEASRDEDKNTEKMIITSIEDYTDNYVGRSNSYDTLVAGVNLKELKDTKQLDTLEDLFTELTEAVKSMQQADKNKTDAELTLSELSERIRQSESSLQELSLQKEDIVKYQETLASYIDRALQLDTGITVGEIHDLLVKLGFEDGSLDIELAAQLLIFPKTGLIAYDLGLKTFDEEGKSISDVFAEAKSELMEELEVVVPVVEPVVEVDSSDLFVEEHQISELFNKEPKEEIRSIEEQEVSAFFAEEVEDVSKEQEVILDNILEDLELDSFEFTNRDKELMEANLNPELFAMNMNTIKTSGLYSANERIIYDYPSFLWDKELKSKIEILTGEV